MKRGNLFAGVPTALAQERLEELFAGSGVRVERIVSRGQTTDGWYEQEQAEWVALLAGEARLEIEGEGEMALTRGDWLLIRPRQRHRVSFTSTEPPCIWLAVHVDSGAAQEK